MPRDVIWNSSSPKNQRSFYVVQVIIHVVPLHVLTEQSVLCLHSPNKIPAEILLPISKQHENLCMCIFKWIFIIY